MPSPMQITRYLWASPNTLLGLFVLLLTAGSGIRVRRVRGVIEAHGGLIARLLERCVPIPGAAAAMTLGHIVIARNQADLDRSRAHERVHVRQCERWGPAFVPAYLVAGLIIYLRGGDPYYDNPFEREAYNRADLSRLTTPG